MAYGERAWRAATLAALLLLPGCETLNRMDYLDQFFDPEGYALRHAPPPPVARAEQPAPQPAPPDVPAYRDAEPPTVVPAAARPGAEPAGKPARPAPAPAMTEAERNEWVRATVRQHPWLALNWAQLTVAQQQRVERRLSNAGAGRLAGNAEPASAWDTMGLDDRTDLAFGGQGASALAGAATGPDSGYAARQR
jgi:hypothetical protein